MGVWRTCGWFEGGHVKDLRGFEVVGRGKLEGLWVVGATVKGRRGCSVTVV